MSQRIKIKNPFDHDQNGCFGCSEGNPFGLKLTFEEDEQGLYAEWEPQIHFQGYGNVLHGGIAATLMDETGAWAVYIKAGTSGVTSSMTVRYLKPVYISKGKIRIEAIMTAKEEKSARFLCRLFDGEGKLCAEADIEYFIYPVEIARRRYYYPGKEAFYSK